MLIVACTVLEGCFLIIDGGSPEGERVVANIVGTDLGDVLNGTAADDQITGLGGNDKLYGKAGNDQLYGGAGDDTLWGDAGADLMFGGVGNDTYYVENISDVVSEETVPGVDDGGKDRVYSWVSFTLPAFIETLKLQGTEAINATGNDQDNSLYGNDAANVLTGGRGRDQLTGGGGADIFMFGPADPSSTDRIYDFTAQDRVGIVASDYGLSIGNGLMLDGSGKPVLDPAYFAAVSGSSNVQGTVSGHGQFVFSTSALKLMWDADGSGPTAGIALTTFNTGAVLSAASFAVTAPTQPPPVVGDISINDVTISEGDAGTKTATFTVSRTGTAAFSVDYATANGSATAGSDYAAAAGALTFAAGQASQTVSVTINGDTTTEGNETFFVNLSNASNGGTILDGQGLGTITNDDVPQIVGDISINDVTISEGDAGTKTATFTVSRTGTAAFSVDYATANGSATAGSDYAAAAGALTFAAGQASQTVSVTINGDTTVEGTETFFVNLSNASNGGTILDGQGLGTITNDDGITPPSVVAIHDMAALGSPDPSGLAYVPSLGTLFLSDSEVEEEPFFRANNMFALNLDGTLKANGAKSLLNFTDEPTGLAFDPVTGRMYISDDDKKKIFWVDPANPTVKLGEFLTNPLGVVDAEDVAVDPNTGHVFIANGTGNSSGGGPLGRAIVETNSTGTQVFSVTSLPSVIDDPEALVYDAAHDVFFVGGGFSNKIWIVNRSGAILDTIDILASYRNPNTGWTPAVKDLELAPSSNPNDDPSTLSLYVADFGGSHNSKANDGRLFEIADPFWHLA